MKRIIAHLDMDAFFAAIEERDNPRFLGMPIAVGSDPKEGQGRGVVATANYKAREYGIHSALPISKAWQLSEAARRRGRHPVIFLPANFERYTEASEHIMAIIREHAPLVEQASVDEAYFDLSFSDSFAEAEKICRAIKEEIKKKEKITASIGIGPNKLIAKIASGFQKPDGLTIVLPEDAEYFLEPLSVRAIPGIGPKTESLLLVRGARTIKDLKKFPREELVKLIGKWGVELYEKIRGRDDTPVVEEYEVKSIGEQETFSKDTKSAELIFNSISAMSKNIMARFADDNFRTFRTVVITVRFTGFETKTRSHTFPTPQRTVKALQMEVFRLVLPFLDARENPKGKLIRLVGVRIEKLA
ncbi:MAG: DNA polymerase IV [Candidatus Azambacteria bacterium]|nr:DNA polymerase IV [Candidatus Azambacteria bacterium]